MPPSEDEVRSGLPQPGEPSAMSVTAGEHTSPNDSAVPLVYDELSEHVRVIRPARPALTYDRME